MKLGQTEIEGKAILAPMAGVADTAFRILARMNGAGLVFTELVSADGLVRDNGRTRRLIEYLPEEPPIGVQIFGSDPSIMADAAKRAEEVRPDFIDLNFGCPVKKVVARGAGAALLNDLKKMRAIVKAVVGATSIPVMGKIRSGWNETQIVAPQAARILEEEGACAVAVHARTRQMKFTGHADWSVIRDVKQSVTIPVIGNGDVNSPEDAKRMQEETGCDLIMVGRGAMGRLWIFDGINRFLETGELLPEPDYCQRIETCLHHYNLALKHGETERVVKEMRKHIGWYLKGMPGSSHIRREVFQMSDEEEVQSKLREYSASLHSKK